MTFKYPEEFRRLIEAEWKVKDSHVVVAFGDNEGDIVAFCVEGSVIAQRICDAHNTVLQVENPDFVLSLEPSGNEGLEVVDPLGDDEVPIRSTATRILREMEQMTFTLDSAATIEEHPNDENEGG